jgi:AAA15 family ATPase/GTPase
LDSNGNQVNFDLNEESHGTRRLLDMLPGLLSMLASDRVVVIDELDSNMHPAITRSIVSSFLSVTAGVQSQLIVTTHDASLLDQDMIRKDEVWFAERARDNSSKLYSLEEFKDIRFDRDLNKSYIEGRFGGVPITSQLQKITFESHEE